MALLNNSRGATPALSSHTLKRSKIGIASLCRMALRSSGGLSAMRRSMAYNAVMNAMA